MICPRGGSYYVVKNGVSLSNSGRCSTPSDKWEAYQVIIPSNWHRIIENNKRETHHVEMFYYTLR